MIRTKNFTLIAVLGLAFAACSQDSLVADQVKENLTAVGSETIGFSSMAKPRTRVSHEESAALLGGKFVVYGTKTKDSDVSPVFDNYVVAHYSDIIQKAAKVEEKVSAKEEKKQREKRRDPILFGVIKNSRKLYYITDWVTDTDDLTLAKLEKELGVTRGSLVKGAETSAQATSQFTFHDADDSAGGSAGSNRRMAVDAYERMTDAMEDIAVLRGQLERSIGTRSYQWSNGSLATTDSARPF